MMGNFYGGYNSMMGSAGLFGLITWIALLSFLVLGSIYFWKEINKPGRK
jgi:hypothetical protein